MIEYQLYRHEDGGYFRHLIGDADEFGYLESLCGVEDLPHNWKRVDGESDAPICGICSEEERNSRG